MNNREMQYERKPLLGQILVEQGYILPEQLNLALKEQTATNLRIGETLVKNGWISEKDLAEAISKQANLPFVSLSMFRPMEEAIDAIPENMSRRLEVVPLSINENSNKLTVAVSDPFNILALDEIRMITGKDVEIVIATLSDIKRAIETFYSIRSTIDEALVEVVEEERGEFDLSKGEEAVSIDDAPVVKLVNTILGQAVDSSASDVHVEPFETETRVRYRIDGVLFDMLTFPKHLHPPVSSRIKIMSGMDIAEKRHPQDGRILLRVAGRRIDIRVSSLPAIYGEKLVMRLLDQATAMVGLERLGLDPDERTTLDKVIEVPYGIILVTGPTGSGKSTTLYSVIQNLNSYEVNITTVEDPVEYTIAGVNQVQINERAGLTFDTVLRSILRQDPDIILVGEMRDTETAQLAVRAALTGHLVLSTLHTNDAPSSIVRMIDMGIPPFLVSSSVVAVMAQRLVRKLCPHCKVPYELPLDVAESLGLNGFTKVYKPLGCDKCRGTGYRGRTAIFEIMPMSEELRRAVMTGATSDDLRTMAINQGMRTLRVSGAKKVTEGITSADEVLSVTL
ncbi:MAG TPA: ATPase, T2SS/T4P/T4SS family [Acetomicrobium sp.]|jgi:type IV pilus assembly protein PilB|uniref:GspE/PulE family protein n=1 Tax=Acetomicrobium TaxID=49894 RepID=UPI0026EA8C77|nr:ATPase, T2SS/T4P/T4SS family [Acetomicrobium mobile]HQA36202.1 ATPase, T2SS/T4P/T4SS family [Acetomicrobium sp.]HQC87610.1 ATPase, T2SS/T4P/T4SS family [Acetomicrobium sp.]